MGMRFSARLDWPWSPPSLLYNGYRVFPGGKLRPGGVADYSPPSSVAVMEEYSYTSTHPLGHTGPVTGSLYLLSITVKPSFPECLLESNLNTLPQYLRVYSRELSKILNVKVTEHVVPC